MSDSTTPIEMAAKALADEELGGASSREARRLAYVRAKAKKQHVTYDPRDWGIVFRWHRGVRAAHHVRPPLAWVTAVSVVAAWLASSPYASTWSKALSKISGAEALMRMTIGFLLVFRLARSATRFWEARQQAGAMIGTCRVLASTAAAHMVVGGDLDRVEKRASWPRKHASDGDEEAWTTERCSPASALCRWLVAFPIATKNQLRKHAGDRGDLDGLLAPGEIEALFGAGNQPLYAIDTMRCILSAWASNAAKAGSAEVVAQAFSQLNRQLDTLSSTYGGMERINNTPLPLVYAAHLRTYLLLYITLIPLVYAPSWKWATPPFTILVSWALLGIEASAVECERPVHECANHIPLDAFCAVIADNVAQTLRHSATTGRRIRARGAQVGAPR